MPDNRPQTIQEEAGLDPERWQPVDAPPIIPAAGTPMQDGSSRYLQGSLPPTSQHDTSFVGTAYKTDRTAQLSLMPLGPSGIALVNSAIVSTASQIVNSTATAATGTDIDTPVINENVQVGTSYTATLADRDTLISMTNNSGGTVTLPGSTSSFAPVQTATGGGSGPVGGLGPSIATASFALPNRLGNFMIATAASSASGGPDMTIVDSTGNAWVKIVRINSTDNMTQWYALNIKAGTNAVTVSQGGSSVYNSLVVEEFSGIALTGAIDQFASGVGSGSAAIVPTVANTFAFVAARYGQSLASGQPTAGPGYTQLPWPAVPWQNPPGIGTAQFVTGLDEYLLNPAVGVTLTGTGVSSGISSYEFIIANFRTAPPVSSVFPAGWYTYVENAGTGTFIVQSSANIDGSNQQIKLLPNTGVLIVSDGTQYWSQRGVAPIVTFQTNGVLNTLQTKLNLVNGTNISITDLGASGIRISTVSGGSATPLSFWTSPGGYPQMVVGTTNSPGWGQGNIGGTVANTTKMTLVNLESSVAASHLILNVDGAGNGTDLYDVGFYTMAGTLVADTGPQLFSSTGLISTAFAQGSVTLQAGPYWFSMTSNNNASPGLEIRCSQSAILASTVISASTAGGPNWFSPASGGTTVGGQLNSSLTVPVVTSANIFTVGTQMNPAGFNPIFTLSAY